MGFDLHGENPISKIGSSYRINIWKWHELWNFMRFLDKNMLPDIEFWYTSDMELVPSQYSTSIYNRLNHEMASGTLSRNLVDFHSQYDKMSYKSISGYRPLSEIDIETFCLFLKDCGGFRIG